MKGVIELNWKILLIILSAVLIFFVLFFSTTEIGKKMWDAVVNFDACDLLKAWGYKC